MENRPAAEGLAILALLVLSSTTIVPASSHAPAVPYRAVLPKVVDTEGLGGSPEQVNVHLAYTSEPAPMGVADYGLGPNGAYQYSTNSSLGSISIESLSAKNASGFPWVSFQLNVNLEFYLNGKPLVYWVQDVADLDTSNNNIQFLDNVWNSSSVTAIMDGRDITGNGVVASAGRGETFYYDAASASQKGNDVELAYPATVEFRVNSSVNASKEPFLTFEYNDGFGWEEYDSVTFTSVRDLTSLDGFVVDGFAYKPTGFFDSELVIAGPGGGTSVEDVSSDLRFQLEYWNGHNYELVSNAYNFGSDTAETISNSVAQFDYYVGNGGVISEVESGAGALGPLWTSTEVSIVDIHTSFQTGTLQVTNSTSVGQPAGDYPFTNGEVTVVLEPGNYDLDLYQGTSVSSAGKYGLTAGELLSLKSPLGLIPFVLSYAIEGGGTGYSSPVLSFTSGGAAQTASLTTTPTTYYFDEGSSWSVSAQLAGSGSSERWEAAGATSGSASAGQTAVVTYYHQYLVTASFSVTGGGTGYSPPTLSSEQLGSQAGLYLGTSPTGFWLDAGSSYSASNPLPGSTSNERWFTSTATGTVSGASTVALVFANQYGLSVTGGASPSTSWYDSGSQATISEEEVYGRASGMGQRVTSYEIDGGQAVALAPSQGNFSVSVAMNTSHVLVLTSVTQYEVTLDATSAKSLSSISPPTISGDSYWYDSGTMVDLTLDGVWGRSSGTGSRLVSYAVNGASAQVDTTGPVQVLSLTAISSPLSVSAESVTQFFLTAPTAHLSSVTAPSIAGDTGWYDNQTDVRAVYDYSWNTTAESRANAVGYSVDGGQETSLPREANGTFDISVTMDLPHSLGIDSVTQYRFTYTQGANVSLSANSPTGDGFYDANTSLTATIDYVWGTVPDEQRQALDGFTLDGVRTVVQSEPNGTYTTPVITFDSPHSLVFDSVTQFHVSFVVTDSDSNPITPTSLSISLSNATGTTPVSGSIWLENGSAFTISSVVWEGVDVKPLSSPSYKVDNSSTISLIARVYDAKIRVVDYFGIPVSDALVTLTLANGSVISQNTAADGTTTFKQIPLGTFEASVTSLGLTEQVSGDASNGQVTSVKTFGSYPTIGVASAAIAALVAIAFAVRRRGRTKRLEP